MIYIKTFFLSDLANNIIRNTYEIVVKEMFISLKYINFIEL